MKNHIPYCGDDMHAFVILHLITIKVVKPQQLVYSSRHILPVLDCWCGLLTQASWVHELNYLLSFL